MLDRCELQAIPNEVGRFSGQPRNRLAGIDRNKNLSEKAALRDHEETGFLSLHKFTEGDTDASGEITDAQEFTRLRWGVRAVFRMDAGEGARLDGRGRTSDAGRCGAHPRLPAASATDLPFMSRPNAARENLWPRAASKDLNSGRKIV